MNKKAQTIMGLSFGTIFSIILIIFIIIIAGIAINHFIGLGKCTDVGFYLDALQDEVDRAWESRGFQGIFPQSNSNIPSLGKIEYVCFGTLLQSTTDRDSSRIKANLDEFGFSTDNNVFLYPIEHACESNLATYNLNRRGTRVQTDNFFCIEVDSGSASVQLNKGTRDSLVTLSKP